MLVLAVLVGWLAGGTTAVVGSATGVALVTLSFVISSLAVAWADRVAPALVLPVGLMTYVVKFTLLGFALVALARSGWDGRTSFAWAVLAAVVTWALVQCWWVWQARIPYVSLEDGQR